jgi:protein-disulfide isomerase
MAVWLMSLAVAFGVPNVGVTVVQAQSLRSDIEEIVREYLKTHPEEVQRIVKDYLTAQPEILQEALTDLIKRRSPGAAPPAIDKTAAVKANAAALFDSTRQVTVGNRQGDVTLVEFFDYNCGYCKRALGDMIELIKAHPNLKIVLKDFPVLGPDSVEVARVAVAVRMQDPNGQKYLAFHQLLLGERGLANKDRAIAIAKEAGVDPARLETDLASEEVRETLEENARLALALGINGTPSYVIGETVVVGAVGKAALSDKVKTARR